jgi:hypothetical protein
MKKNLRKIQLSRETLRHLEENGLDRLAGGIDPSGNPIFKTCASGETDCHWTCPYSECNGHCNSAAPTYCGSEVC